MVALPVLLLPPRVTPDSQALQQAAVEIGWNIVRLESWRPSPRLREGDLVLYGEPLFADIVAEPLGLALLEPTSDWLTLVPRRYLQRAIYYTTLAEARHSSKTLFIKPALDKCFPAGVYASGKNLPGNVDLLPESTPVLLAEPVQWEIEFRCFVLERTLAAISPYLRAGALAQAADGSWPASAEERVEAERFLQAVLADEAVPLPPAVTLDIGRIVDHGWAIVEANAAWGSGIYGCSPERVLTVLRRATLKDDAVPPADRFWVRPLPEVLR
jgi:hypothetical protein